MALMGLLCKLFKWQNLYINLFLRMMYLYVIEEHRWSGWMDGFNSFPISQVPSTTDKNWPRYKRFKLQSITSLKAAIGGRKCGNSVKFCNF